MTAPSYKIVLSDKLFSIYKKASTQEKFNAKERKIYESLIGNIELDILTNAAQLERCKQSHNLPKVVYDDLYSVLLTSDDKDLSLTELSKNTLFKLVVTQAENEIEPPYFNLKKQHLLRNYTITRQHDQDREYLQVYFKHLLEDASVILIHDKYFSEDENNARLFECLLDENITIQYVENQEGNNGKFIRKACKQNTKWNIEQCDTTQDKFNRFARSHDRYLLIDDKLEITLTSGFLYIWNNNKEITCVIREIA